ncbi:uncharacterized protein DUF4238 [Arenibacter algicola]|uniref:Uncharacterized protein DUF4238 n=1 Tax=Arenibacter algicola TaxID=616991 RepID=A0ABY3A7N1_9FLAO
MNLNDRPSKRHHYIPKFLIKEFSNEDGLLYVYDKEKDRILEKPRSPKSIFFENERNTITINEKEKSSLIEDVFFKKLDDTSSKYIKELQSSKIVPELLSDDNLAQLQFFMINLFWRLPITDFATKDLIKRAKINSTGIDPETLRNDKGWNKIQRMGFYKETIEQMGQSQTKRDNYYAKIAEFEDDLFLIGDYPFIFKNYLRKFTDLVEDDYCIALSSKRILSSSAKPLVKFTRLLSFNYNATIIEQSKKYVASNNLKLLQASVEFYKKLKEKHLKYFIKNEIFEELK